MTKPTQDHCHPAILLPEILLRVFEEVRKDPQSGGGYKSLGNLALTCTAWRGPAYDVSWREVNIIRALQALAPISLVEETDCLEARKKHKLKYQFVRSPTLLDWIQFDEKAQRVRTLHAENLDRSIPGLNLSASLIEALNDTRPVGWTESLFPHLATLIWKDGSTLEAAALFADDKLKELSVVIEDDKNARPRLLKANPALAEDPDAAIGADGLPFLSGSPLLLKNVYVGDLVRFIRQRPQLEAVHIEIETSRTRSGPLFPTLAALRCLEELRWSSSDPIPSRPWAPTLHTPFSSLKRLDVKAPMLDGLIALIALNRHPQLHELVISLQPFSGVPASSLVDSIAFHVDVRTVRLKDLSYPILRYSQLLSPLAKKCSAIENLEVGSVGTLMLTDDELHQLATRLPALRRLVIDGTRGQNRVPFEPRLTMKALAFVVAECHSIQHIALDVDGSTVPSEEERSWSSSNTLQTIDLGYSHDRPIGDIKAIALYLSGLSRKSGYSVSVAWDKGWTGTRYDEQWEKAMKLTRVLLELPVEQRAAVAETFV